MANPRSQRKQRIAALKPPAEEMFSGRQADRGGWSQWSSQADYRSAEALRHPPATAGGSPALR